MLSLQGQLSAIGPQEPGPRCGLPHLFIALVVAFAVVLRELRGFLDSSYWVLMSAQVVRKGASS